MTFPDRDPIAHAARQTRPAHQPARPHWCCTHCGHTWPCAQARTDLLADYTDCVAALGMYLSAQMFDAAIDLRVSVDAALYDRFLRWIRPADQPPWPLRTPA